MMACAITILTFVIDTKACWVEKKELKLAVFILQPLRKGEYHDHNGISGG
jgi:hypothetical protein